MHFVQIDRPNSVTPCEFAEDLSAWPVDRVQDGLSRASEDSVRAALHREDRRLEDLLALLSPQAGPFLEEMAEEARRLTRHNFGRCIGLYTPLYLSNVCGADCTYCGYSVRSGNREDRVTLSEDELRRECETLRERGFQSILLLTGEARRAVPVDMIARAVTIVREYFPSVSVEIYSLDARDYLRLTELGLEGVTIYMETYDRDTYGRVHLLGEKADYDYRLGAIERAGNAGARKLNIGVLLGLFDWRVDAFWTLLHARYLQRSCWQSSLSLSFPRLSHVPSRFEIPRLVSDRELVHYMLAVRLFLPEVGMNVSTRETAEFRDRLIPLGTTMMSAGSSTRPGGYATHGEETLQQFAIEDHRSPRDVAEAIRHAGYEPVWKDFDRAFDVAD